MRITVFGGSTPKALDANYQEALQLGKLLAEAGHTVLTGGYMGTMEAVSRGASEADGHVIGVTSNEIEAWRPGKPNNWIKEELRFKSAHERLVALVKQCDAAIALPGGAGTLAEIAALWKHLIISSPRPFIIVGPKWESVFESLFTNLAEHITAKDRDFLAFAPNIHSAVDLLQLSAAKS
ncbi:MAG: LOG family protein [Chloroflexi bacterium]|nr:LOG family protein [Chloroflexota bacterium]